MLWAAGDHVFNGQSVAHLLVSTVLVVPVRAVAEDQRDAGSAFLLETASEGLDCKCQRVSVYLMSL